MKKLICCLGAVFLLLSGCTSREPLCSDTFFAMDTVMEVRLPAGSESVLVSIRETVSDLEARLSVTDAESETARLNRDGQAQLSAASAELLAQALALCGETGGALDLSVRPVLTAWGFTREQQRIPSDEELSSLLPLVDYRRISFSPDTREVKLEDGMELDFGSVAKGYAADQILTLCREQGIQSGLLNLGGNVQVLGSKPDGSAWQVGIRDPRSQGYLGILNLRSGAAVTSGSYERYFEGPDGTRYFHIIDPATGKPARSGLQSVTVVGESGLRCDGLSTALFVMGPEKAAEFWRSHRDFEMILVTDDLELLLTPGLSEIFTPEPDCSCQVIAYD